MGLNWRNFFTRPRHKVDMSAPFTHVQGYIFAPGAGALYAYVPEKADPTFESTAIDARPLYGFVPLKVTQPAMDYQGMALGTSPQQGYGFDGLGFNPLTGQDELPEYVVDVG